MKFLVLLVAIALIPVAAGAGFMAHKDPPSPPALTLDQALLQTLTPVGEPQISYVFVVTKGRLRGQTGDPSYVATLTRAQLAAQGALAGVYARLVCQVYDTNGEKFVSLSSRAVQYCKRRVVTKARALRGDPVS